MFRKILESKIILVILFIALALLWGLSFVFIKKSLVYLEPIELLSIRWAIAVAFFLLLPPVWGNWRNAFLLPPNPYTRNKVQNGARATIYLHILLATYCAFVAVRTYSRGWISFPAWW